MKKIYKQLCKLFPETTINVVYSISTIGREPYRVYIADRGIWEYNWSNEFKTLKDLDEYLDKKIENYKKVY